VLPSFWTAAVIVLCGTGLPAGDTAARTVPPDILLIMPDQMRGDCLSVLGHPCVKTPTLDRLAAEGTLFRRAYSTVPSCIPARYALLSGLAPQSSGVVGFRAKPIEVPTLPQLLHRAGYQTAIVGRNMHQKSPERQLGYQTVILGSTYVANDDYDRALRQAAPQTGGIRSLVKKLGLSYNLWPAAAWPLEDKWHPTTWVVHQSQQVLENAHREEPLFLTVSFYAPHPPLFPPPEYFERYLKGPLPEPAHGDWVDWEKLSPQGSQSGHRVLLQGDTLRRAQAGYFGLIEHLDHQIAPLVEAFISRSQEAGHAWVIVVTSDHGEMLGDHGYFRKCEPFEGSANIPLIVCGSADLRFRRGQRCFQPVCLEDILPTLLDLAGAECPAVDGVSLLPVLRGEKPRLREWLHFEHAPCYSQQQAFHALTDGRIKYIWRPTEGRELLFDLMNDPREEHNLATDPACAELLARWRRRLIDRLAPRAEGFSDGQQLIPGRPYHALTQGVPNRKSEMD